MPLSVLAAQGYDTKRIEETCADVEDHAVLGKTYRLELKTVSAEEIEKKVWKDLYKSRGDGCGKSGGSGGGGKAAKAGKINQ